MPEELHSANANIDRAGNARFAGTLRGEGALQFLVTGVTTTTYTVGATDVFISCSNTAARVVTLPDAGSVGSEGRVVGIKDTALTAATATLTVKSAGGTLDGTAAATGVTITNTGGCLVFIGDGTNWKIIAKY